MSSKQALRAFQTRLNERLQTAQATGVAASWLAVEAGQQRLLFPLSHAGQIYPLTDLRRVPYTQPWFLGVANLRGGLSAVVDLAAFLAGGDGERPRRNDAELAQCRLVAINPLLNVECAVLVERLQGLRTTEAFTHSLPPSEGAPPYIGHEYVDTDGRAWREINLQHLSEFPAFLSVGV